MKQKENKINILNNEQIQQGNRYISNESFHIEMRIP